MVDSIPVEPKTPHLAAELIGLDGYDKIGEANPPLLHALAVPRVGAWPVHSNPSARLSFLVLTYAKVSRRLYQIPLRKLRTN